MAHSVLIALILVASAAADDCVSSASWTKRDEPRKDCAWVGRLPEKRCDVRGSSSSHPPRAVPPAPPCGNLIADSGCAEQYRYAGLCHTDEALRDCALSCGRCIGGCIDRDTLWDGYEEGVSDCNPTAILNAGAVPNYQDTADVMGIAGDWVREGTGSVVVDVPIGAANSRAAAATYQEIRAVLGSGGVPSRATTSGIAAGAERGRSPDEARAEALVECDATPEGDAES